MLCKPLQEVAVPNRVLAIYTWCGHPCPVTNLFDLDGDEIYEPADACSAVIQLPNGCWLAVEVDNNLQALQ